MSPRTLFVSCLLWLAAAATAATPALPPAVARAGDEAAPGKVQELDALLVAPPA